jgi:hypothetical protein
MRSRNKKTYYALAAKRDDILVQSYFAEDQITEWIVSERQNAKV